EGGARGHERRGGLVRRGVPGGYARREGREGLRRGGALRGEVHHPAERVHSRQALRTQAVKGGRRARSA
ncbi:hypothetical protein THAOC_08977, partial [Thalassiosira oceanica]